MSLKRWTYIIGFGMVGIMGLSAIMPLLSQNVRTPVQQVEPTAAPTLPPPPETESITFEQTYLHPSGLFTVAQPSGWTPSQPITSANNVRAVFSNQSAQSIIQVDIDRPAIVDEASEAGLTLDDVDTHFSDARLDSSWSQYEAADTNSRTRVDDHMVFDFALTSNGQDYVARQTAWTDGEWIYSVRVVMPENAIDALRYLVDNVTESVKANSTYASLPLNWKAYFDQQDTHIIRYPADWTLADSAPGRPTSIEGNDATLRVETEADAAVSSEDDARNWVEQLRAGANILSVEPVSRDGNEGYAVSYSYRTVDGDPQSGLAVLLNGQDNKLHVANLRFSAADVDLNADELDEQYSDLASVMATFDIMPDLAGVTTN